MVQQERDWRDRSIDEDRELRNIWGNFYDYARNELEYNPAKSWAYADLKLQDVMNRVQKNQD